MSQTDFNGVLDCHFVAIVVFKVQGARQIGRQLEGEGKEVVPLVETLVFELECDGLLIE